MNASALCSRENSQALNTRVFKKTTAQAATQVASFKGTAYHLIYILNYFLKGLSHEIEMG
jgi:hypothetical protein